MNYDYHNHLTSAFNRSKREADQYFTNNVVHEPIKCSVFGCGKTLRPQETLFGNKCIEHNGKPGTDATLWNSI